MSRRGISGGKQKKKLLIRQKNGRGCLFSQNEKDDSIVMQNARFEFRQVLSHC